MADRDSVVLKANPARLAEFLASPASSADRDLIVPKSVEGDPTRPADVGARDLRNNNGSERDERPQEPPHPALARPDHDRPKKTEVNKTRRDRAPTALQVNKIASRTQRSAEENSTFMIFVEGDVDGDGEAVLAAA